MITSEQPNTAFVSLVMKNRGEKIKTQSIIDTHHASTNENIYFKSQMLKIMAIEIDNKHSITDFLNIKINIGGISVFDIPFSIMYNLSKITYSDKKCYINVPSGMFMENEIPIPLHSIPYMSCSFMIESNKNIPYIIHLKCTSLESRLDNTTKQYHIHQYCKADTQVLEKNIVPKDICALHGIFVETNKKIENMNINYSTEDVMFTLVAYNKYVLDLCIINKDIWTKRKSEVFNIIMEKILPYEMIHYIEEYIGDTYTYYIPIDIDDTKWNSMNGNYIPVRKYDEPIIIDFCGKYNGNLYYSFVNNMVVKEGTTALLNDPYLHMSKLMAKYGWEN